MMRMITLSEKCNKSKFDLWQSFNLLGKFDHNLLLDCAMFELALNKDKAEKGLR